MKKTKLNPKVNLFIKIFLSVLSGFILTFAFPPFEIYWIAFVSFIPLFFIVEKKPVSSFFYGITAGFTFYSISLFWIKNVAGPVYLLLSFYLSIYWAIFLYLSFSMKERGRIFTGGSIWFLLEIIIANLLTGFPWLPLGLSQWENPYILKIARISGIYGISFLIILANFTIYSLIKRKSGISVLLSLILFSSISVYNPEPLNFQKNGYVNLLLVQPNITSKFDKNPYKNVEKLKKITEKFLKKDKADIVIWPEGTFNKDIADEKKILEFLKKFTEKYDVSLIFGTFFQDYNSAIFISNGELQIYRKIHLVPYGEFIPGGKLKIIRKTFFNLAGYIPEIKRGKEYKVFKYKNHKIATIICFENIFPNLIRKFKESELFVVITNDSWFGKSSGPYQHFSHNIFRAVETGKYFVQTSLTGITGIVNPEGKIEKILKADGEYLYIRGVIKIKLPLLKGKTFYSEFGDFPLLLFSLLLFGFLLSRG